MNPQAVPPQTLFGLPPAALVFIVVVVLVIVAVAFLLKRPTDGAAAVSAALLPPKPIGPDPIQQLHDQGLIRDPDVLAIKAAIAKDDAIQRERQAASGGPPPVPTATATSLRPYIPPPTNVVGETGPAPSTNTAKDDPLAGLLSQLKPAGK